MSNISCSLFSSINQVLLEAYAGQLNITTTIDACPNICTMAWGTGNPDLSGVGANISYIFQAVLTFVCGPLLCTVYKAREHLKLSKNTVKHLSRLQDAFLDISAQFGIPVAIAAVIRFRQQAPFYELAFLRALLTMQFLSLLSSAVVVGLFMAPERRGFQRILIIVFYGVLEFGFFIGFIKGLITTRTQWATITELTAACVPYGHIFPWIEHIPAPAKIPLHLAPIKDVINPFSTKGDKSSLIISLLVLAGIVGLLIAGCILYFGLSLFLSVMRGRKARWIPVVMSLGLWTGTLVELIMMERIRSIMKEATGTLFQDNEWGFGQVVALFLWLPLCTQFIYYISGAVVSRILPERSEEKDQTEQSEDKDEMSVISAWKPSFKAVTHGQYSKLGD